MCAAAGRFLLVLTMTLLAITVTTGEARNFSALLTNPLGVLQQAGKTMMDSLLRPRVEPRPAADRRGETLSQGGGAPGQNMAERVASLVKDGLQPKKPLNKKQQFQQQQKQEGGYSGLFGGFMRLLGLDSTRLGAIAINAFVYVSEMIAATLTRMKPNRDLEKPEGSPFSWLLDNPGPKIAEALKLAQSRELPEILINLLKGRSKRSLDYEPESNTHCLQRLMCQMSPVLWGMQEAVAETISPGPAFKKASPSTMGVLWRHLPTRDKLREQSESCETRFSECELPDIGGGSI